MKEKNKQGGKNKRKRVMNERGIMTYMIALTFTIVFAIFMFTIIIPMLQQIEVTSFDAQEKIMADTNTAIQNLPSSPQKTSLLNTFNGGLDSVTTNFDILGFFIQYWWIFVVLIISLGTYVLSRRNVEVQGF